MKVHLQMFQNIALEILCFFDANFKKFQLIQKFSHTF